MPDPDPLAWGTSTLFGTLPGQRFSKAAFGHISETRHQFILSRAGSRSDGSGNTLSGLKMRLIMIS